MRKRILRKFRSERGASLSLALLLFMICAVLGGIILASATAASGRLKNLVESDRRYYSVTSAAQLLAKELSEAKVEIVRSRTVSKITDAAGKESENPPAVEGMPPDEYDVTTVEAEKDYDSLGDCSFLAQAANELLFFEAVDAGSVNAENPNYEDTIFNLTTAVYSLTGETAGTDGDDAEGEGAVVDREDVWNATFSTDSVDPEEGKKAIISKKFKMKLQINHEELSDEENFCMVQCNAKVQPDGTVVEDITNVNDDEDNHDDEFTLRLVMRPDYTETQTDDISGAVPHTYTRDDGKPDTLFVTTKKETKTSTITWFVLNVKVEKMKKATE